MMADTYVHGYDERESERLLDQAGALVGLLHSGTSYGQDARVLEVGCGVGAQSVTLALRNSGARFTSVDRSGDLLAEARRRVVAAGATNVDFVQADVFALPFGPESFDHVFVCFVLEHLHNPLGALVVLHDLLREGGTITVIEGDHGSAFFHPDNPQAHEAIRSLVELQRLAGGDAFVGRRIYPLLSEAGFASVRVDPKLVYVDSSRADLVEGFTRRTFTAMIEGARESVIEAGLIEPGAFDAGVRALHRAAEDDGVFCYSFFKGTASKRPV